MLSSCYSKSVLQGSKYTKCFVNIHAHNIVRGVTVEAAAEKYEDPELAAAKPFKDIPSLPKLPFIGSAWVYFPIIGRYDGKKMHLADFQKNKTYGDIVYEQFGHFKLVNSFLPETMEVFHRHEGKYPFRGEFSTLKAYRESRKQWYKSTGIMILKGKEWHDLRFKTQKYLMKPRAIQAFLQPMNDVASDFITLIRHNRDSRQEVPGLLENLYKWALESVAIVGLDARLDCLNINLPADSDGQKMITAVQTKFECMNKMEAFAGRLEFWKYFKTPTWKRFENAGDIFTEIAFKYINKSMEKLKSLPEEDAELTLLQSMMLEKGLDVSGVMVTVADMLMAGIDTTSHTVGFLLYDLAKNPEKQKLVFEEIHKLLPRKEDQLTSEIFNKLHYLKACLKESIRLRPIVRGNARTFDHDVVLSGYRIPAGVAVMCLQQVINRNEKYYKNANEFIPERWLEKDQKITYPYSFVPFGVGIRSCIGRRLAELEVLVLSAQIIRNFAVEYHHEDIDMFTRLINTPDKPLRFNFLDR